jgi:TFIIF-interacting CTD phosphatase-like protein
MKARAIESPGFFCFRKFKQQIMNSRSDILLILDLDETLIHATEERLNVKEDFSFDQYLVYKRPELDSFLHQVNDHFKIAIWSSAGDEYVAEIVKKIKPDDLEFEFVWARSRCTHRRDFELDLYYWEKRLDKLKKKGFLLEKILIVDDSPEKARNNFGNAIYIKAFTGDPSDNELASLYTYLLKIKDVSNVRKLEKRNWKNKLI